MKLHAENRTVLVLKGTDGIALALSGDAIARRWIFDVIAMIHPRRHLLVRVEARKNTNWIGDLHFRATVFAPVGANHLPALDVGDELHPVTDAEYGCDVEFGTVGERIVFAVHGVGSTDQVDP